MESRIFIKLATQLRKEIKEFSEANLSHEETQVQGQALQKDIHAAFQGLQNPTLPSADKLLSEALNAGFAVPPQVVQRISQAQHAWN